MGSEMCIRDRGIHSYNETVEIEDVVTAAKAYVAAVCDLMGIE